MYSHLTREILFQINDSAGTHNDISLILIVFDWGLLHLLRICIHLYFYMLDKEGKKNPPKQIQTFSVSAEALWWLTTELVKRWWGVNGCEVEEVKGGAGGGLRLNI